MTGTLFGAPFAEWIEAKSPKGAVVRIWGQGDEYSARFEAADGHAVVYDTKIGAYAYARKDVVTGALVTTGIAVGDETSADLAVLAGIPLHERDVSDAFSAKRKQRIESDESNAETRNRWQDLKKSQRESRRYKRAIDKGEEMSLKAPPSSPTQGKIVGVTLLIDFPTASDGSGSLAQEVHPDVTKAELEQLVNGENFNKWGNVSSVRKYYEDVSGGNLVYTNIVLGWLKAAHPRSYYDDSTKSCGVCARPLIGEILEQIAKSSEYSSQYLPLLQQASYSGSYFKALNVFFAGSKSPVWDKGLWAHKSTLGSSYYSKLDVRIGTATKYFNTYQISPVTESPSIGTFCHENGHMICGFPDLYSYEDGGGNGVGSFCLMSSHGTGNPQYVCAYLRAAAGWVTPREMPTGVNVLSLASRLDDVWSYSNPMDDSQYFLVENRQRRGRDSYLPGGGILIWRCDENGDNTRSSSLSGFSGMARYRRNYELSLEQADGLYELEREINYGQAADCWYRGNSASKSGLVFSDATEPCAKWKDGTSSGLVISGFSANDDVMTFHVGEVATPSYTIDYSLGGGTSGSSHPSKAKQGEVFCVSAPTRGNDTFLGWSVSGLDNPSAKYGTTSTAGTTIPSAATRCKNGVSGNVYFRDLAAKDGAHVTLIANWRPTSNPTETGNWYVAAGWGSDANAGTSWSAPFASLQKAVDAATSSTRSIIVYDGQYEPFASAKNIYMDIRSVNGAERTIVDGSLQWSRGVTNRCAKFYSNYQTMTGFTLLSGRLPDGYGGGSYYGTLSNCIYRCNSAYCGGGAYAGVQHGCHFCDNAADYGAGGYYGTQYGCQFDGNVAEQSGGGSYGGALYGCLLHDNMATWGGGCYTGTLWNCTVSLNSAVGYGGGVHKSKLRNCIVWDNMASTVPNAYVSDCSYTCSTPQETGVGNLSADPEFMDAKHGDFRLMGNSPCINAGTNQYVDQDKDLDGNPRIIGGAVDMGAYEWQTAATIRPVNDNFANATLISGASGSLTASSENATRETGEPSHGTTSATNSVWWKWTATATGSMTITTEGSGFDTGLGVYTGTSVDNLDKVDANDDVVSGTVWSSVTFPTVAGTTYYIAVAGYKGATGSVKLNWSFSGTGTPTVTEFPYKLVNGNAVITNYAGTSGDVVFPAVIDGHPVTEIAANAFYYGTYPFVNVTISEGIQKIGHAAFGYSSKLETFSIPSTLTTFGDSNGFEFYGCPAIRSVSVANGNPNYKSVDGVLYNKAGTTLIYCPASKNPNGAFAVPATVTHIAKYAFSCSKFKTVTLPETITKIEEDVFNGAQNLTSMVVPSRVSSIGGWAFEFCYALTSVTIPPSVTSIGDYAFGDCRALKTVYVSQGDAQRVASLYSFDSSVEFVETGTPTTYAITYVLGTGGAHGSMHPTSATYGTAFYVSAPTRTGYIFAGWTVTSGLNTSTAKWGTSSNPSTAISSSSTKCVNGATGNVYFKNLTSAANGSVTLTANWSLPPPAAPTGLSASGGNSSTSVSVGWTAVSGAASYEIWRGTSSEFTSAVRIGTSSAADYADTTATFGRLYYYWVKAVNAAGTSELPTPVTGWRKFSDSTSNIPFTTGGNAEWVVTNDSTYSGTVSLRSGKISNGQSTWLEMQVAGPSKVSFYWKPSSEANYDELTLSLDGSQRKVISGVSNYWTHAWIDVPSGTHALGWTYAKDGSVSSGSDCGWVDSVGCIPISGSAPSFVFASQGTSSTSVTVSWSSVANATAYRVYRGATSAVSEATQLATVTGTSYTDSSAETGVTYSYWVRSVFGAGYTSESAFGNPVTGYLVRIERPANNDFANAAAIAGSSGTAVATNTHATYEQGEPLTSCWPWATNTVWWVWSAPSNGIVQVDTAGTGFDTELGVYTGSSLATLEESDANDDSGDGLLTSACVFECVAGSRYYFVAAGGYRGAAGTIRLNWRYLPSATPFVSSGSGRYGLFVGINQYVLNGCGTLTCCEKDIDAMCAAGIQHGGWTSDSCRRLVDEQATKTNVRAQLASLAEVAKLGDTVLFYQSSHGGQKASTSKEVCLCTYDKEYWDYELADDLARFRPGVKLVVVVDACHSGGLFKDKGETERFDLPARVMEIMRSRSFAETKGPRRIEPEEIGWISAADYNQTSQGGSSGSEFTMAMVDAWTDDAGMADLDGDRRLDFYDLFKAAELVGAKHGAVGQCANESVLKAVTARLYAGYVQPVVVEVPGGEIVSIPGSWFTSGKIDGRTLFDPARFVQLFGTDYDAAARMPTGKVDAQGNPMYVWQDFVAGTDPTDKASKFKAYISFVDGKPVITWTPDLNEGGAKSLRTYRTLGINDLSQSADSAAWREVTPGNESAYGFFKVEVNLK